jgi:hypothetical protein
MIAVCLLLKRPSICTFASLTMVTDHLGGRISYLFGILCGRRAFLHATRTAQAADTAPDVVRNCAHDVNKFSLRSQL